MRRNSTSEQKILKTLKNITINHTQIQYTHITQVFVRE